SFYIFFHFRLLFIETFFISVSYHEEIKDAKYCLILIFHFTVIFFFFSVNREPWPNQNRRRKRSLCTNEHGLSQPTSHELVIGELYLFTLTLFSFQEL
ncbi:unnamed protein product, partial [Brassica oleracea]